MLLTNAEDTKCLFAAVLGNTSSHTFLGSSLSLCMYLVYRLFTLFVLLCLFFHFFPLFQFIDELKQISQVQNYRFSLQKQKEWERFLDDTFLLSHPADRAVILTPKSERTPYRINFCHSMQAKVNGNYNFEYKNHSYLLVFSYTVKLW